MTIDSISAAGLSQFVLSSGDSTQLQPALQSLQNSLGLGDLNGAQAAFQTVLQLNQSLQAASGGSASGNSQLNSDLTALGSALSSGDLSSAESAFVTVQKDFQSASSPSQTNENNAATQSELLVEELLSTISSNSATSSDVTNSVLQQVYGSRSGLNVFG